MLRSLRTIRSFPRIKDIALILGKHGFYQVAEALQAPIRTRLRRIFKFEARHTIEQPERLCLLLEELGPTFVKFGQFLSTRPDLLPERYLTELRKLQDDVSPRPWEEVRESIEAEFGRPVPSLMRRVDAEPLAAASIAQVHRAETFAGDDVVVKVRRQGLERVVQQDLQVLGLLAEFLRNWPDLRLFDPEGVVRLFERSMQRELNFDYERNNLLRIRGNIGAAGEIHVPRVYPELSGRTVLTMEFLPGRKLSALRSEPVTPELGKRLATTVSVCMLKQVIDHGVYHADPHPGNFILMDDGRVGLIDFGNVGTCTPELVDNLLLLVVGLIRRDYRAIARWLVRRGGRPPDLDAEVLALELMDALDPHYGMELSQIRIGSLFEALFAIVSRQDIKIPAPYVHLGRTFITLEGVVRLCSPELELLPAIQPYISEVLRRRWSPERLVRDVRADASELFSAIRSYPANLAEVLSRAASGRIQIESSLPELTKIESRLEQTVRRVPVAILACGLLVSSSILLFSQSAASNSLPAVLGAIGFIGGLILAAGVALRS